MSPRCHHVTKNLANLTARQLPVGRQACTWPHGHVSHERWNTVGRVLTRILEAILIGLLTHLAVGAVDYLQSRWHPVVYDQSLDLPGP